MTERRPPEKQTSGDKNSGKPHYAGHRGRLRERFMRDLGASMEDYEILEMLLALALPRVDTKPLAKDLLDRFGSFAGVIAADPVDLAKTRGIKEAAVTPLKLVQTAALRLAKHQIMEQPVISSWDNLISYLHIAMSREKVEHLRLLFLDNKNRLIADEVQQRGTVNHTPLYPREVMKRALDLHASALILVHNHPSGDPTPSADDIHMTNEIRDAADRLGIRLHDHIIIGRNTQTSFKAEGLL